MKHFSNRNDENYRKILLKKLSKDGADGLIESCVSGNEICIAFTGISSTTLFDYGGNHNSRNEDTAKEFAEIFKNVEYFNKKGIVVKIQILLVYPYSTFAFSRILAESGGEPRPTVEEPDFEWGFNWTRAVNIGTYHRSTLSRNQRRTLQRIQSLINSYPLITEKPNAIEVRFTPIGSSLCMLRINDVIFFDTYILGKKSVPSESLLSAPLFMLNSGNSGDLDNFNGLLNHFSYLWSLDTTLTYEDAVSFESGGNGQIKIKEPAYINFNHKKERISSEEKSEKTLLDKRNEWHFAVNHNFKHLVQETRELPVKETLFISASWVENKRGSSPNSYALELKTWLEKDFAECMNTSLVATPYGEKVQENIHSKLQESTLSIVLLTKDYQDKDGQWYAKPNIYHELGYFTSRFQSTNKWIILAEDTVHIPSNISHYVRGIFTDKKSFMNIYPDILIWLKNGNFSIPKKYCDVAQMNHDERVPGTPESFNVAY